MFGLVGISKVYDLHSFSYVAERYFTSLKITDWENVTSNRVEWRGTVYKRELAQKMMILKNNAKDV